MKLSIILPGYFDPYHEKTVRDLLDKSELGDKLEIISVFDGFWPTWDLVSDPRRRIIHLGRNRGMRGAIVAGILVSRGEFIGRMDEHCLVAQGMDKVLTDECQPNWILTPRRKYLNPETWTVMKDKGEIDYEDLTIQNVTDEVKKFAGRPNREKTEKRKHIMVDKKQAMQGSFWIMPRKWWDKHIGDLDTESLGPLIQDSVEVCMKTWQAGGELFLTKNTWYAHKHRSFPRSHNNGTKENPSNEAKGYKYALDTWGQYYNDVLLPKWTKEDNETN